MSSLLTPRRGYFALHDHNDTSSVLPFASDSKSRSPSPSGLTTSAGGAGTGKSSPRIVLETDEGETEPFLGYGAVPTLQSPPLGGRRGRVTLGGKEEAKRYREQGLINRRTVLVAFLVALALLLTLGYLGREDDREQDEPGSQLDAATLQSLRPAYIPPAAKHAYSHSHGQQKLEVPDFHEQCHGYYASQAEPDHDDEEFLDAGAHELEELDGFNKKQAPDMCDRSLTYFLDSNFGLFYHLTAIAQAYSLARLANRTLFIEDANWDRGSWQDHFQPMKDPGCRRPPMERMKACPRGTRHWALDGQTLHYHYGKEYRETYDDHFQQESRRHELSFLMSHTGFHELLIPSDENARLIRLARQERADVMVQAGTAGQFIGVHVRRGDKHPKMWRWRKGYVPVEEFLATANAAWLSFLPFGSPLTSVSPFIHLATDDVFQAASSFPRTSLYTLSTSSHPSLRDLVSPMPYHQLDFSNFSPPDRLRLTRGVMVDFDLLAGGWTLDPTKEDGEKGEAPMAVVCTVSSNVCKMAMVAMGWRRAVEEERWINLDGRYTFFWRPTEVP